jgi:hypothetical protein
MIFLWVSLKIALVLLRLMSASLSNLEGVHHFENHASFRICTIVIRVLELESKIFLINCLALGENQRGQVNYA